MMRSLLAVLCVVLGASMACLAQTTPAEPAQEPEVQGCPVDPDELAAAAAPVAAGTPSPVKEQIRAILAGPDFSPEETIRMPVFKKKPEQKPADTSWMKALEKFFGAVAEILRVSAWVLAGLGVVLLLVSLHYWWRMAAQRPRKKDLAVPTQVAGLDIRPESLPDDVGGSARSLWQRGDAVGALSLLYRGALSALVVRFGAAIKASFTEQECLRAARAVTSGSSADYFQRLTRAWVHAVYAKRRPGDDEAVALCDEFNAHFAAQPVRTPLGTATPVGAA